MLITALRYQYRTHSYLSYTACVCVPVCAYVCVCVGMGFTMAFSRALQQEQRGVDDVEEELGPQWRKGVVNAQKRLQPQSRPDANPA